MSRSDRILVAGIGIAIVLAVAAAWLLLIPAEDAATEPPDGAAMLVGTPGPSTAASGSAAPPVSIVVDVEGAVAEPGVRELPAGSRIADAIAAAGGYGADVDLAATAASINLAQPMADGEQVYVPRIGDAAVAGGVGPEPSIPGGSAGGGSPTGGLVDINTASPEQLEALPGIGPVTVQKIVAARQEQPFASLDDAVQRGVLNRGQVEDIQGLATAG
ncbi:MAG: ComEA family DNA-binding protein [Candidatus Limnocylindria bacterium]